MPLRRLRAGVQPSYPTICRERRELGTASPAPPIAPGRCDAPRAPLTYPKLRRALCTTKLGAKPAAGPRHPRSRAPDALLPARRSHKSAQRSAAERGPRSWAEAAALLEQRSEATRKTKDCDATFKNPKKKKIRAQVFVLAGGRTERTALRLSSGRKHSARKPGTGSSAREAAASAPAGTTQLQRLELRIVPATFVNYYFQHDFAFPRIKFGHFEVQLLFDIGMLLYLTATEKRSGHCPTYLLITRF